jgi:hypothetical protein
VVDKNLLPIGSGKEELMRLYEFNFGDIEAGRRIIEICEDENRDPDKWWKRVLDAKELLAIGEEFIKTKNRKLILEALNLCMSNDFPVPAWCAITFMAAYKHVRDFGARHWDEVFGEPHKKGTNLEAAREKKKRGLEVFMRVEEKKRAGSAVDGHLFETVGRDMAIGSKTKIEEIYYKVKKKIK